MKNKNSRAAFTLVETIIAIGLFGILVSIAVGGFVNALHTQKEVGTLISAQSNVSLAVEEMAREIRTGYLFCHADDGKGLNSWPPNAACDGGNPNRCIKTGNETWTCPGLSYINAQSESVSYSLANGALMRSDSAEQGGTAQAVTGNDVTVRYLSFTMNGQLEDDGCWSPFITISIGMSASSSDPAITNDILHFQTSVSARQMDYDPNTKSC